MADFQARITEYNGVVYRSKSEAIFARVLHQHIDEMFEYEPAWTQLPCGYVVDFDVVSVIHTPFISVPHQIAIEYKPGRITDTCKNELLERFNAIRRKQTYYTQTAVQYTLVTGNAYNDTPCTIEIMDDSGNCFVPYVVKQHLERLKQWMVDAKGYRFDLVEPADEN